MKVDYIAMYKTFLNLQNSINDLDVLEEMANNLDFIEEIALIDDFTRFGFVVDDTTSVYMGKLIGTAQDLLELFTPLCDDFLGISKESRQKALNLISEFLISYGLILYKSYGYEIIADYYSANNNIDPSKMQLPPELLDEVSSDLTRVIDTLRTILVVFKSFGAYFAEYEIADMDDLNDVIASLEDRGYGTEAIGTLSEKEVNRILGGV